MCGRYASSRSTQELVEEFRIEDVVEPLPAPSYNVAPSDEVRAVVERVDADTGAVARKLVALRWGLVPSWSKQPTTSMINARSETVATKPAFRKAFATRRCLLPADGYYEWQSTEATPGGKPFKQPYFLHPESGLFVMAGIYEFWKQPDDTWLASCSIITTSATDELGHIHDRMPMVVTDRDAWLDPTITEAAVAESLLRAPDGMDAYAVGRAVGNVRANGPELIAPLQA